jgi:signal peptidase I
MPDDRDDDVGPAADREDLFGRAPDADEEDSDSSEPSSPGSGTERDGTPDSPDAPLFAAEEGGHPDPAGRDEDGSDASTGGSHVWSSAGDEGTGPAASSSPGSNSSSRSSTSSFFRELPVLLLVAFLLAFLLRTFVLQVFFIPSGSMENTLQIDDRMVVEKITYLFREPVRGEIVVFEGESFGVVDPDATAGERVVRGLGQFLGVVPASARDYVKRVIGLPGDEILIEDGEVFVNGRALDEPYVVFEDPSDFGPVTVPADHLFFLGDNRPNSSDSRRGLGFVPQDAVVGRSAVIIWPFDHAGLLTGVEHEVDEPNGSAPLEEAPGGDDAGASGSAEGHEPA